MTDKLAASVFIGSSSEALTVSQHLKKALESHKVGRVEIWNESTFGLSSYTLDSLVRKAKSVDFAVLIVSPDDKTLTRGLTTSIPRDNTILEYGLFVGAIGRERTIIVSAHKDGDEPPKLASDLNGLTVVPLAGWTESTISSDVGTPALDIAKHIKEIGPIERTSPIAQSGTVAEQPTVSVGGKVVGPQKKIVKTINDAVDEICRSAVAQGWRIHSRTEHKLSLVNRRDRRFTHVLDAPGNPQERLTEFARVLAANGIRMPDWIVK